MHVYQVLLKPLNTEKSNVLKDSLRQYSFEVDRRANKIQIKEAVETAFNVNVLRVNVINRARKARRRVRRRGFRYTPATKKAIVAIPAEQSIQLFEGV
jgi:large subunit ribosomal protein L23